ncbi:MAG: amidohydrolase family protein [Bacilli bacterium]|nr:amidohydrolase family protein [Bacilli bacterium]
MKALIHARTYDYHNLREDVFIRFDSVIQEIGPMDSFQSSGLDEIIDVSGQLVLPGFVSGHTHLYSAFARGMTVPYDPKNFRDILEQLWWKLDHFLDLNRIRYSALSFGIDQMATGTTTFIDHHASGQIKGSLETIRTALCEDLGARAILAFETSDRFNMDEAIAENVSFIQNHHGPMAAGLFGLHASFTLSEKTLKNVRKNLNQAGIHIHVAESQMDEDWTKEQFQETIVERLDRHQLLNENSILVHCANVQESELDLIRKRGCKIAINTTSNMNNAVGLPNLSMIESKGIDWFIGNDGLISSMPIEYLNAYYTAHLISKNPVGFSLASIKNAIIQSYEFAGKQLQIKLGRLETGYVADLITVPYQESTPLNESNVFGHLFFGLYPNLRPKNVFVNGVRKIADYQQPIKWNEWQKQAKEVAKDCWETIEKEGMNLEFKD